MFQGHVGQDSLSTMIRRDELAPRRGRRPFYDLSLDMTSKQNYPHGQLTVCTRRVVIFIYFFQIISS